MHENYSELHFKIFYNASIQRLQAAATGRSAILILLYFPIKIFRRMKALSKSNVTLLQGYLVHILSTSSRNLFQKKFLYFLLFWEMKPSSLFSKQSFSYISGNPQKFLYLSGNGTFLYFGKWKP